MNNLNIQKGNKNSNIQNNGNKPDSSWKLIWTGIVVVLISTTILGLWKLLFS